MIDIKITLRRTSHWDVRLPLEKLANKVLGPSYQLSLVMCGDTLATRINKKYRKKASSPNVLSFELAKNEGEIFLNIRKAQREAKALGVSLRARLALLYVHGLYHLKGLKHSDNMEQLEQKTLRAFRLL